MKLTSKQISYLKSQAMTIKAFFQVGKEGLGENFFDLVNKSLEANELIKFRVLNTASAPIREIALDVCSHTNAILVQIVGKVVTLYRPSKKIIYQIPRG